LSARWLQPDAGSGGFYPAASASASASSKPSAQESGHLAPSHSTLPVIRAASRELAELALENGLAVFGALLLELLQLLDLCLKVLYFIGGVLLAKLKETIQHLAELCFVVGGCLGAGSLDSNLGELFGIENETIANIQMKYITGSLFLPM